MNSNTIFIGYLTRTGTNYLKKQTQKTAGGIKSFQEEYIEKDSESVSTADMTMDEYKTYIHDKISSIPMHPSRMHETVMVHISDEGFEAMKNDPEYEAWVLNSLRADFSQPDMWAKISGGGFSVITYGATKDEARIERWRKENNKINPARQEKSYWEQRRERLKKLQEEFEEFIKKRRWQETLVMRRHYERQIIKEAAIKRADKNQGKKDTSALDEALRAYEDTFMTDDIYKLLKG